VGSKSDDVGRGDGRGRYSSYAGIFHTNVNARAQRVFRKSTPLHNACASKTSTNLDFIQLLLDHGANPNEKDSLGAPLYYTLRNAPAAAKFLLTYSDKTDPDILMNDGQSFLTMVRSGIEGYSACIAALKPHSEKEKYFFLLKQWEEVEKLLVERRVLVDSAGRG
jgi:hypothetical protein